MMNRDEIIRKRASELQEDCHSIVAKIMKETSASHQDATNVWLFMKIAELELKIQSKQKKQIIMR